MGNEFSVVYNAALGLLTRREHSVFELRQKLAQRRSTKTAENFMRVEVDSGEKIFDNHDAGDDASISKKNAGNAVIDAVIARLQEEGYQSDNRFVEVYLHSRLRKGFGLIRIARELAHKGIVISADELAEYHLTNTDDALQQLWQKKFGSVPKTPADKYKQIQFFRYRGFDMDEISQFFRQMSE